MKWLFTPRLNLFDLAVIVMGLTALALDASLIVVLVAVFLAMGLSVWGEQRFVR